MIKSYALLNFILLISCSLKTTTPGLHRFEDGLYYSYKKGVILSSSKIYVTVQKNTAYAKIFYKESVDLSVLFQDTLVKKNDTLFSSKNSSIVEDGNLYLIMKDDKVANFSKVQLHRANEKILKEFNSYNNLILYNSLYKRYFEVYSGLQRSSSKDSLYGEYYRIGKEVFKQDQSRFLEEIMDFKRKYLDAVIN